ncbi:Grx4 family monothiol glutaredoxin [Pneumocystis jirovecii RU7]|uniref:Grx4 family monothiol glutaredoxin n=1 Tax=Pneumocystis jirovecii (strain RU7) TaxID=1408657 RepID=A0A0W4ZE02_PNEJ7|nr:Grx4 family monothiol glutaredoxin [Pneumocystis jirovecii RU7]KTW26567.1 Grx4 family monothiol glutaredoxin [Pneumocystis jirovecii RU7]
MSIKTDTIYEIQSTEDYQKFVFSCKDQVIALNFYANWAQPCQYMNNVFQELSLKFSDIKFANINAEELEEISESFEISVVPFFIILQQGKVLTKVSGANPPELTKTIAQFSKKTAAPLMESSTPLNEKPKSNATNVLIDKENEYEDLTSRLEKLVKAEPVMLFMKGTPDNPQCGFSRQIVDILNDLSVKYGFFNILSDQEVREGLKEFSNWPTYPQLYIQGNLCGGLDIVREMIKTGEIQKLLQESGIPFT